MFQQGLKIEIKEDKSPVSNGDLKVNDLICSKISKLTPDIPIISEETVDLRKKNKSKIVCLTAYSKNIAQILDKYCDIILVGDSMANVLYGLKDTHNISLENIIQQSTILIFIKKKKKLLLN